MQQVLKMQYISLFPKHRGAKNSMPKLHEVIGRTKTKIREDVQTDGSWPQCSKDWRDSIMPSCCCFNDMGNKILFRLNISLPLTKTASLDRVGLWHGLPGHRTSHQWTSSYWVTLKHWFTCCQLILKRLLTLKQRQLSGSAHIDRFSCVSTSVTVHSVAQKSITWIFLSPKPEVTWRYSCHHNSSRFTFSIFVHSWRFSVFHS
jgi:hypothetical protein